MLNQNSQKDNMRDTCLKKIRDVSALILSFTEVWPSDEDQSVWMSVRMLAIMCI